MCIISGATWMEPLIIGIIRDHNVLELRFAQLPTESLRKLAQMEIKAYNGDQYDIPPWGKGIQISLFYHSRAAFLHDPTHKVVFHYTPKHASWMNQVEIWLSILVRKLLKRGHFLSLDDLRDQILAFIAYYNRTIAKPINWTYTGLS